MTYDEHDAETHRDEIINALVNRFIDNLSIEDALEYVANDMSDYYARMTTEKLIRELEE